MCEYTSLGMLHEPQSDHLEQSSRAVASNLRVFCALVLIVVQQYRWCSYRCWYALTTHVWYQTTAKH